ncbi:MAG: RNA-binding S4 domain-containing protein [Mycoplasmoidaceae bacterium]|nr:RNA-binding S4 domain-containing protein [Mycoplasmoidaceae bacterium]
MLNKKVKITSDFITLAQLLKFADVISSGGEAKSFLANNTIKINDVIDNRRRRKLFVGDQVVINTDICLTLVKE